MTAHDVDSPDRWIRVDGNTLVALRRGRSGVRDVCRNARGRPTCERLVAIIPLGQYCGQGRILGFTTLRSRASKAVITIMAGRRALTVRKSVNEEYGM